VWEKTLNLPTSKNANIHRSVLEEHTKSKDLDTEDPIDAGEVTIPEKEIKETRLRKVRLKSD